MPLLLILLLLSTVATAQSEAYYFDTGLHSAVSACTFSPDGHYFAASGETDDMVKIWDTSNWRVIREVKVANWPKNLYFTPDGQSLIIGHAFGVEVRDWKKDSLIRTIKLEEFPRMIENTALSPDGKTIAVETTFKSKIFFWDLSTGNTLGVLDSALMKSRSFDFSPDGKLCLSSCRESELHDIRIRDMTSGNILHRMETKGSSHWNSFFFGQEQKVLYFNNQGEINTWDLVTQKTTTLMTKERFYQLAFPIVGKDWVWLKDCLLSEDEKQLYLATVESKYWTMDMATGETKVMTGDYYREIVPLAISPDRKTGVVEDDNSELILYDMSSGVDKYRIYNRNNGLDDVVFSPDGKRLLVGENNGEISVWDMENTVLDRVLKGHQLCISDITFSPDGAFFGSASEDSIALIWDAVSWQPIQTIRTHKTVVTSIDFMQDGKCFATAGYNDAIFFHQLEEAEFAGLQLTRPCISNLRFSPDGSHFACIGCGLERDLSIYKTGSTKPQWTSPINMFSGFSTYSPDGKWLLLPSNGSLRLLNARSGKETTTIKYPGADISSGVFNPDGKYIAGSGSHLVVWERGSQNIVLDIALPDDDEYIIGYSPDGRFLTTTSYTSVHLRDAVTGALRLTLFREPATDAWVACRPDGAFSCNEAGKELLYTLDGVKAIHAPENRRATAKSLWEE